ncbi:MAG: hypothetical protein WCF65_08920 [Parachlamydiaceae bacterium]
MSVLSRIALFLFFAAPLSLSAAGSSFGNASSVPGGTSKPGGTPPSTISRPAPSTPAPVPPRPLIQKPALPVMTVPFEMPGVVGWQNGKWVGSDFLGYLTTDISIDVEILKTTKVMSSIQKEELESLVVALFKKEGLNPQADVKEGPPLPFLHILLTIYPTDKDRYVIICAPRLFEHIQVIRKDFVPAGFWQGITWESLQMDLVSSAQLDAQMKAAVEKAATTFITRYWQYNKKKGL